MVVKFELNRIGGTKQNFKLFEKERKKKKKKKPGLVKPFLIKR